MTANAYDAAPCPAGASRFAQPEQLAVVACLFGLSPLPPSRARVLGIGCDPGAHLIALAARYPQARFVGIDMDGARVEHARTVTEALGLRNIEFRVEDFGEHEHDGALFDYVICDGVYSWVAPGVQEAIMRRCAASLAPDGVAFLSYNTYPGWKMREVLRDAMLFHAREDRDPGVRLKRARALAEATRELTDSKTVFGRLLADEAAIATGIEDSRLHHEMEAVNRPCYFHELIERARACDLVFLGEAVLSDLPARRTAQKAPDPLAKLGDHDELAAEQYLDFFRNRSFRQTLLVPAAKQPLIKRAIEPLQMERFFSSCPLQPVPGAADAIERSFKDEDGRSLRTANATVQAMLAVWAEAFPRPIGFAELNGAVARLTASRRDPGTSSARAVAAAIMRFALEGIVRLHPEAQEFGRARDPHPRAFAPAVEAVRRGHRVVSNLRHESVPIASPERDVLLLVDGGSDAAGLRERIVEAAMRGAFPITRGNTQVTDPDELRAIAAQLVLRALQMFERQGLLVPGDPAEVPLPATPKAPIHDPQNVSSEKL